MTTIMSYDYSSSFSLSYQEYELIQNILRNYESISDQESLNQSSSESINCSIFFQYKIIL